MTITFDWLHRRARLMRIGYAQHRLQNRSSVQPDLPVRPAKSRPVILVLSVSAGAGHVRAAHALCAAAVDLPFDTVHIDVMDCVPRWFRHMYTDVYVRLVGKFPHVWGWLYRHMQRAQPSDRIEALRRAFERTQTRALVKKIASLAPDAIICTHFLPAELLAHLPALHRPHCPIWIQITDFDVHRIWIQPAVAGYLAGTDEVAFRLRAAGVAAAAIHVTGLPVMREFALPSDRRQCAGSLGLDPSHQTVLLMGGGAGTGELVEIAQRLLSIDPALQLIVLTGRNLRLLLELAPLAVANADRLVVHGQTAQVERFMACADLIVTKSGGLTSAECLAAGLPMVINAPIPGQEERNADYLVEQGVAMKAIDPVTVEYRVRLLLADSDRLARMAVCARVNARPDAAAAVLKIVGAQLAQRTT